MSAVPPPSRRVLAGLKDPLARDSSGSSGTAVTRAWQALEIALDAHEATLAALDRLEAALIAAHGHPTIMLPARDGAPVYASEAVTINRWLERGPESETLFDYFARLIRGETDAERGDHAVF